MFPNFSVPGPSDHITKAPARQFVTQKNLARAKANSAKLSFMMETRPDGTQYLYNKRSPLPPASAIIAFNRNRQAAWAKKKSGDMRTADEHTFSTTKKASLKKLKMSRNHKIPDHFIGAVINRAVITSTLDGAKTKKAKAEKGRLRKFAVSFLAPLPTPDRTKALQEFNDNLDKLMDSPGTLTKAVYRKRFDRAKRILSSSLPNLRLGSSSPNSGLGESNDPNFMKVTGHPVAPPSPISKGLMGAQQLVAPDLPFGQMFGTGGGGKTFASSFTK